MKLSLTNQGMKITLLKLEQLPRTVLNRFHVYSFKADHKTGKKGITETSYAYSEVENAYYFHSGSIQTVVGHLKLLGINFETDDLRSNERYPEDINFAFDLSYRGNQKEYIDTITKRELPKYLVGLHPGGGKANSNRTRIITPSGYKAIGDIEIGDSVIGKSGCITTVTGVYPQGVVDIYLVTYSDKTTEECSLDHLHTIYDKTNKKHTSTVLPISELIRLGLLTDEGEKRFKIAKAKMSYFTPKVNDNEDYYTIGKNIRTLIEDVDESLLFRSERSRRLLLSGLEAKDIDSGSTPSFLSESETVSTFVANLFRSLGHIAMVIEEGENFMVYLLNTHFKEIDSIELSHREDATCITIDSEDSLYLVEGFTPTHNTIIATKSLATIGERFLVLIKAGYIAKWYADLEETLGISKEEIFNFSGGKSFFEWVNKSNEEKSKYKCFIASSTTMANYLKSYEANVDVGIKPSDLLSNIRANIILTDEVHQHFASISNTIIRLDPVTVIALSATLIHKDKRRQYMYDNAFPPASRLDLTLYQPYMKLHFSRYRFEHPTNVIHSRKGLGYNQNLLEEYILRCPLRRGNFFRYIHRIFKTHFLDRRGEDDKALFLVDSRLMANLLTATLSKFSDLDVRRNIREDSYEDLMEATVSVATIGKGSTAVDISNLFVVFNIVCSDSLQFNIQAPGRLREREGVELRYIQCFSPSIDKHVKYMRDIESMLDYRYKAIVEDKVESVI